MKNKTLYTLFAIIFLASFVSANTYQTKIVPEQSSLSVNLEYSEYLFDLEIGDFAINNLGDWISLRLGDWINGSYVIDNDINTYGLVDRDSFRSTKMSHSFDLAASSLTSNFTIPSGVNVSDSSIYYVSGNEVDSPVTSIISLGDCEILNDGVNDYVSLYVLSEDFAGGSFTNSSTVLFCYNSGGDYAPYQYLGVYDGLLVYALGLNLSLPDQPQQNIQTNNFEVLGSTGLGLSRFFGGLTSSLSGLLLIFAIVGAIVLVLGGVVFLVMYAINYAKTR
jgi:hypothetical protein